MHFILPLPEIPPLPHPRLAEEQEVGWGSMSGNGAVAGRALGKDREMLTHSCVNVSMKESTGLKVLDMAWKTVVPVLALVSSPGSGIALL